MDWFFLDGGTLELGIVRDSVLRSSGGLCAPLSPTYPIFTQTFENVAQVRPVRDALPAFVASEALFPKRS